MNQALYTKIKLSLIKYNFNESTTFAELWHFSKQFNHKQPFKQFTKIVQDMGVGSRVYRDGNGKLKRGLYYKPEYDRYIKGEIMTFEPCPNCNGTGMVKTPLKITEVDA